MLTYQKSNEGDQRTSEPGWDLVTQNQPLWKYRTRCFTCIIVFIIYSYSDIYHSFYQPFWWRLFNSKNNGKIGPHTSWHELTENDVTLRFSQIRKYIVRDFDGRTFLFTCENFGHSTDWLERISLLWKFPP